MRDNTFRHHRPGTSEVYKENAENEDMSVNGTGNSEFKNKRVPLDGIELLLNRDRIPDKLGQRMDNKNINPSY